MKSVALIAVALVIAASTSQAGTWQTFTDLNITGQVYTMLEVGSDLYIGGSFDTTVNGEHLNHIARHGADGAWHALGDGVNHAVWALAADQDGGLLVGGEFDTASGTPTGDIAKWSGSEWSSLGGGFREHYQGVHAIVVTSTGIVVGGQFATTQQGDSVNNVAIWDGMQWKPLGKGITPWRGALPVFAMVPWKNGIAVAGYFSGAGGQPGSGVAIWDGSAWTTLYDQASEVQTSDIVSFNGSIAYAVNSGGDFGTLPGFVAYDGHSTYPIPSPGFRVGRLAVLNGAMAVGNDPLGTNEETYHNVALFNAGTWEALDGGTNNTITYLAPDEAGTGLLVAGYFTEAGGSPTSGFAIWRPSAGVATQQDLSSHVAPFPNPAVDYVSIVANTARVFSAVGQELNVATTSHDGRLVLDVSMLQPGLYFVQTERGTERLVKLGK